MSFKRVGVFGVEDLVEKSRSARLTAFLREEMYDRFRFELAAEKGTLSWPAGSEDVLKWARKQNLDLAVGGKVARSAGSLKLTLGIFEARTGGLFAVEHAVTDKNVTDANLQAAFADLLDRLIRRIPYKGMVAGATDDEIRLDVGSASGIEEGTKVEVFEIAEARRHPYSGEAIEFKKLRIGEATVQKVSDREAVAKVTRREPGRFFRAGQKVEYQTSPAAALRAEAVRKRLVPPPPPPAPLSPPVPRERFHGVVQAGIYGDRFQFESDDLEFDRKTDRALSAGIEGDVWFSPAVGMGFSFQQGSVEYDRIDSSRVGIEAILRWYQGDVRYRRRFPSIRSAPSLEAALGYQVFEFHVDRIDSPLLTDYRIRGPFAGLGLGFHPFRRVELTAGFEFLPILEYDESQGRSGDDPRTTGFKWKGALIYAVTDRISVRLAYCYGVYDTDFSGSGSRNGEPVSGVRIKESYDRLDLGLTARF